MAPNPQINVTDIYDTAVNPEPDDIYDEAMPGPVSSSVKIYSLMLTVLLGVLSMVTILNLLSMSDCFIRVY